MSKDVIYLIEMHNLVTGNHNKQETVLSIFWFPNLIINIQIRLLSLFDLSVDLQIELFIIEFDYSHCLFKLLDLPSQTLTFYQIRQHDVS